MGTRARTTTRPTPTGATVARRPTVTRRRTAAAAVLVAAALGLSACSGSDSDGSSSISASDSAASGPEAPADGGSAREAAPGVGDLDGGDTASEGQAVPDQASVTPVDASQQLARRASMSLRVKDIAASAAKVRSIAAASDGIILSENIGGSDTGTVRPDRVSATTYGEVAISVPATRLDATLDQLAEMGTLLSRDSSSENVAQQIVDTSTRTKTMEASVDRIRALMAQTTDIEQVVQLEGELSRRTADLESLKSQLAALEGSVARSPIQVSLTTDTGIIEEDAGTGFLAGLAAGWGAFTGSVVVVLTVLGALLPFLLLLTLVGIPLAWVVRRRRPVAPTLATPTAPLD